MEGLVIRARVVRFRPKSILAQLLPSPYPTVAVPAAFFSAEQIFAFEGQSRQNPFGFLKMPLSPQQYEWLAKKNPWLPPTPEEGGAKSEDFAARYEGRYALPMEDVFDPTRAPSPPPDLGITPLPYQLKMFARALEKRRAVICAGVGAGKTIVIGLILARLFAICSPPVRGAFRALILVPRALFGQWERELVRIFQHIRVLSPPKQRFQGETAPGDGAEFTLAGMRTKRDREWAWTRSNANILITNAEKARTDDLEAMLARRWDLLVIDEANVARGVRTQVSLGLRRIQAKLCYLLTGTPAENGLQDFYGLSQIVDPDLFVPGFDAFRDRYLVMDMLTNRPVGVQNARIPEFKRLASQIIVSARTEEINAQLPPLSVHDFVIELDDEEASLYEAIDEEVGISPGEITRFIALPAWGETELLTKPGDEDFAKLIRLEQFLDHPALVTSLRGEAPIDTSTVWPTKLRETIALIKEVLAGGAGKVLVFTRFAEMAKLFHRALGAINVKCAVAYSQIKADTGEALESVMQRFEHDPAIQVLVSTDVISRGWNAQFCHHLINYDLAWNPAVVVQRMGRIRRMGAEECKQVYNIIVANTLSEKIYYTAKAKERIIAAALDYNSFA